VDIHAANRVINTIPLLGHSAQALKKNLAVFPDLGKVMPPVAPRPWRAYNRAMTTPRKRPRVAHMLGLGLDNHDGHVRVTQGDNFSIFAGSEETHARMQRTCIKVNEKLARKGKQLADATHAEIRDLLADVD
jgi:hypothetical protein